MHPGGDEIRAAEPVQMLFSAKLMVNQGLLALAVTVCLSDNETWQEGRRILPDSVHLRS